MRIAALDIETCSLDNRAHVTEVAVVKVDYIPEADRDLDDADDIPTKELAERFWSSPVARRCFTFDFYEQVKLSRCVANDTLAFHERIRGLPEARRMMLGTEDYPLVSIADGFKILRDQIADCDQLWINGLSFDPVILRSLQQEAGIVEPAWDFQKECDVRTVRKTNPLVRAATERDGKPVAHRAYEDALWNIKVAVNYLEFVNTYAGTLKQKHPYKVGVKKSKLA